MAGMGALHWPSSKGLPLTEAVLPAASANYLPCRVMTGESGLVLSEEGNPAGLSSCSGGLRPPVELCWEGLGAEGEGDNRG